MSFFACFFIESSSIFLRELIYTIKMLDLPIFEGLGVKLSLGGSWWNPRRWYSRQHHQTKWHHQYNTIVKPSWKLRQKGIITTTALWNLKTELVDIHQCVKKTRYWCTSIYRDIYRGEWWGMLCWLDQVRLKQFVCPQGTNKSVADTRTNTQTQS